MKFNSIQALASFMRFFTGAWLLFTTFTHLSIISQKTYFKADVLQHQANGTSDIIQDALKVDDVDGDGGDVAGLPCVTEQALRS